MKVSIPLARALIAGSTAMILLAATGCGAISESLCIVESQDKIDWDQKPEIQDGYLVMSGKTKGGLRLHDVETAVEGLGYTSTFDLHMWTDEGELLQPVGAIWPDPDEVPLSGFGETDFLADEGGYNVTDTEFSVKVKLNEALLSADRKLVVGVWGEDPLGEEPLSTECVSP